MPHGIGAEQRRGDRPINCTSKCAANMRQSSPPRHHVQHANKGHLLPELISAEDPSRMDRLGRRNWCIRKSSPNAPNIYKNGTTRKKGLRSASVFRCPEGLLRYDWPAHSGPASASDGNRPNRSSEKAYAYNLWALLPNPRADGTGGYGVASWYQLNPGLSGYGRWIRRPDRTTALVIDKSKDGGLQPTAKVREWPSPAPVQAHHAQHEQYSKKVQYS